MRRLLNNTAKLMMLGSLICGTLYMSNIHHESRLREYIQNHGIMARIQESERQTSVLEGKMHEKPEITRKDIIDDGSEAARDKLNWFIKDSEIFPTFIELSKAETRKIKKDNYWEYQEAKSEINNSRIRSEEADTKTGKSALAFLIGGLLYLPTRKKQ